MQLLVASNNPKKLAELERIVEAHGIAGIELLSLNEAPTQYEEPAETGRTFAENALIKARAGAQHTGLVTVADDSGLAVDELNGMPGVLSARWSGAHGQDHANNELLLGQMRDVPDGRRHAAFVSVCALVTPDGQESVSEGRWEGTLARSAQGEGGFGYDPLFIPAESTDGRTAAQLSPEEKDALSHRGKALTGLVEQLLKLSQTL